MRITSSLKTLIACYKAIWFVSSWLTKGFHLNQLKVLTYILALLCFCISLLVSRRFNLLFNSSTRSIMEKKFQLKIYSSWNRGWQVTAVTFIYSICLRLFPSECAKKNKLNRRSSVTFITFGEMMVKGFIITVCIFFNFLFGFIEIDNCFNYTMNSIYLTYRPVLSGE